NEPRRRVLFEVAERLHRGETGALEALVVLAAHQLDRQLEPETAVDARHARERFADDQRDLFGVASVRVFAQGEAHVAATAAGQRLRFVAEVAKNGVVATAAPFGPANQLEKHAPLVLDHREIRGRVARATLEQRAPQREVARADEEEPEGGRAV